MLRATTFLGRSGILNPLKYTAVAFPRNLKPIRGSSTKHCEREPPNPPADCPPKKRCQMDYYPIPCGSWQENYDRRNAIFHRQLIASAGLMVFTLIVVNRVGWVKGYPEITLL